MKPSRAIKSVSELKAHASEILREVGERHETLVITQNGEARAVLQDIHVYEEMQESLALLRMLAQSKKSTRDGGGEPLRSAFASIRKTVARDRKG